MEEIVTLEGKFKISDNKIFLLKLPNPHSIYIKTTEITNISSQNPIFFKYLEPLAQPKTRNKVNSITNEYSQFEINKDFHIKGDKNDCLLFAEKVALGNPDYDDKSSVFKVESDKQKRRFGQSDKQNSAIVTYTRTYHIKKYPTHNDEVNPDIGDAYAMVPHSIPIDTGVCPYHAATVIFKDGTTNITIEADAGIKSNKPIFDMYSSSDYTKNFFTAHKETYTQITSDPDNSKINIKLPTVLHLKRDYKPKTAKNTIKPRVIPEQIRRSSRLNKEIIPEEMSNQKELSYSPKNTTKKRRKQKKHKQKKQTRKRNKKWFKGR
jgi:hypothetical protein